MIVTVINQYDEKKVFKDVSEVTTSILKNVELNLLHLTFTDNTKVSILARRVFYTT